MRNRLNMWNDIALREIFGSDYGKTLKKNGHKNSSANELLSKKYTTFLAMNRKKCGIFFR